MQTIQAMQTKAAYDNALRLGPDNFEAITAQVFNATAIYQVFTLGGEGDWQTGDWGDELYAVASDQTISTLNIARCGGIQFKTNPNTPANPALVNAWAWKDGEPQIQGLTTPGGSLGVGGGLSATGMITGDIPAAGTTPSGGSGFTYTHTNGTGVYIFTLTTPFATLPIVTVEFAAAPAAGINHWITARAVNAFTVNIQGANDTAFMFTAQPTV